MLPPIFLLGFVQAFEECREFFLVRTQVDEFVLHDEVFFFAVVPDRRNRPVGRLFSRQVVNCHSGNLSRSFKFTQWAT